MKEGGKETRCLVPWLTFGVAVLAIVFQIGGESCFVALVWRSDWLGKWEVWRFLTGHLAHVSGEHLVWDLGVFLVLGGYLERVDRRHFLWTIGLCVALTDIALRVSGRFDVYCGLSAIDVGLFGSVCLRLCALGRQSRDLLVAGFGCVGILLVVGKLGFELFAGETLFVGELARGFSIAVESHLAGVLAALVGFFVVFIKSEREIYFFIGGKKGNRIGG